MNKAISGFLLMVLAAVGLALSTILMKVIPQVTPLAPAHVSIWRFLIAGALFWIVMILHPIKTKGLESNPYRLIILGFVFGLSGFSAVFALNYLPSSIYVIIIYIYPSLVVLYSLISGKSVPKLFWLGLPLTFLGLFLTAFDFGSVLSVDPLGFLITIVNAIAMTAYFLLSERFFGAERSKFHGTRWMLTGALVFSLLWIPFLGLQTPHTNFGWLLVLTLGIFGTFVPLLSINVGLQQIGAARGSVIITLQPILAVLFSTLFLGETLTLQQWLGGAVVIAAIILLQLSADQHGIVRKKRT
jgi:drug/metabolite transporter (DMT)-like permease